MKDEVGSAVVGLIIGMILVTLFVGFVVKPYWKEQVIQRGYGLYCPNTGDFAFKGECEQ